MAGEKRTKDSEEVVLAETTILLDIEGTTTSISFVKDTLFPYVRENLKKYIDEKWGQDEFKADLEKLKEQAKKDEEEKVTGFLPIAGESPEEVKESLVKNVLWQMDEDRKTGALKQLQGHMWRQAYESGAVKGHVFEDVPKALESWTNGGRKVYIYSSGSVEAQKLLFTHSESKDLTKYLSGYFDTEVGAKQEAASYKNILNKLSVAASSVLFLTDVVKEAEAAKEAGITATIVIREGNAPLSEEEKTAFSTIKTFDELSFQSSSKRQKIDTSDEKKETVVEEPAKSESTEKIEHNGKSQVDNKTESPCEPMDTSEDVLEEAAKKPEAAKEPETAKPEESKVVVEAEQNEKEKPASTEEDSAKSSAEDSKEKPKEAKSEESKAEPAKTEEKKDEAMVVDEPDKAKSEEKVEKPVEEAVKQDISEEKKETETESSKTEDSQTKSGQITESKTEEKTETKLETSEKSEEPKVAEEKVSKVDKVTEEKPTETKEEKPTETKEEKVSESKVEKIPEIVVEKAPEVEATKEKTDVKENGGVAKVEETKEAQPELRSEKPEKEAEKKEEEAPEKVKEAEKTKEVEKVKEVENGKEEESKVNGTSNGEEKHSNGVSDKEKSDSNSKEATSSQNGDAETSESSEAIKVKKVVDSTVADGAGEPEVVTPPVAVAATS